MTPQNPREQNCDQVGESSSVNLDLINGILSHFEILQLVITLPTYDGNKGNPAEFLEKIEKYFMRKKIKEEQKLLVVEDALKGRARIRYEARLNPFIDFEHFRHVFLNEFYSLETRMKLKSEWEYKCFKPLEHSLLEHFNE